METATDVIVAVGVNTGLIEPDGREPCQDRPSGASDNGAVDLSILEWWQATNKLRVAQLFAKRRASAIAALRVK